MDNFPALPDSWPLAIFAAMPRKLVTLRDQLAALQQELERSQELVRQYRSAACVAETEAIRLQLEIKNRQREADGLRAQNFALVDRLTGILQEQSVKES